MGVKPHLLLSLGGHSCKMEIQEKRKKVQKPPPLLARARAPERMGCDELRRVKLAPPLAAVTSPGIQELPGVSLTGWLSVVYRGDQSSQLPDLHTACGL